MPSSPCESPRPTKEPSTECRALPESNWPNASGSRSNMQYDLVPIVPDRRRVKRHLYRRHFIKWAYRYQHRIYTPYHHLNPECRDLDYDAMRAYDEASNLAFTKAYEEHRNEQRRVRSRLVAINHSFLVRTGRKRRVRFHRSRSPKVQCGNRWFSEQAIRHLFTRNTTLEVFEVPQACVDLLAELIRAEYFLMTRGGVRKPNAHKKHVGIACRAFRGN